MKQDTFRKYMQYGKLVQTKSGQRYKLIETIHETEWTSDTVLAVEEKHLKRYQLLKGWVKHKVGMTEEEAQEMNGYEERLAIDSLEPANEILLPNMVQPISDLSYIQMGNQAYLIVFIDDYHVQLVDGSFGNTYHTRELAELCSKNLVGICPMDGVAGIRYETGCEETEILGSGSTYQNVEHTNSFVSAQNLFREAGRNYIRRTLSYKGKGKPSKTEQYNVHTRMWEA